MADGWTACTKRSGSTGGGNGEQAAVQALRLGCV